MTGVVYTPDASAPETIACDHCGTTLGMFKGGKLKIRIQSRCLVVRPDGGFEMNCHECRQSTNLPFAVKTT
jgi:hypothetical protein